MIYLRLFWEFFKTGLFAIGGGLAALPFLSDMAERTGWFTKAMLADMIAVAESTPGPIGINMATYAGFTTAGVLGSLVATLALALPSLIIVLIVARPMERFKDNRLVQGAFYGLRPAVVGLIVAAGYQVVTLSVLTLPLFEQTGRWLDIFSYKALILLAVLLGMSNAFKKMHPILWLALAAVAGMVFKL